MIVKVKDIRVEKVAAMTLFALLLLCLVSVMFTLVRGQPDSIEKDLDIDCKWNGAPVSANLKWTEPKENPAATTNTDAGSKTSQSGTTNTQANTASTNTQQALMLTGMASGAALVGGGTLAVKKKLEGSSSSEQETKQAASTSTTSSTPQTGTSSAGARSGREVLEPHQDELKSSIQSQAPKQSQTSTQSQSSTQTQQSEQSNAQNPPKDNGSTSTASNILASAAVTTGQLWMQNHTNTTSAQAGGTQQTAQVTSKSTSTSTSQNIGLLASSSSAAQIANEMWPQRQKELEQLAKQRSDLATTFSTPSYSTGLASSFTSATENTWARLQGFSSALSNGLAKAGAVVKTYMPYIVPAVIATIVLISVLICPPVAPAVTEAGMAGMGMSLGGAGLVGAGVGVGVGYGIYQLHNLGIMNYPQQPGFEAKHTQYIQQSTSEIKDEKGSGTYGVDPAKEQIDQADIGKDKIIQGEKHEKVRERAEAWLKEQDEPVLRRDKAEPDPEKPGKKLSQYGLPDISTKHYIVECKLGEDIELTYADSQKQNYMQLAERVGKRLVYWFLRHPNPGSRWWQIIHELEEWGCIIVYGDE